MENMTDKKRIVLYDAPGQICNRFWDHNICCFDALRNSEYVSFPFYSKIIISIVGETRWQKFLHLLLRNRVVASFCRSNTAKRLGITESWYGSVPLAFIEKVQTDLKDNDFSVIHDFYHFKTAMKLSI